MVDFYIGNPGRSSFQTVSTIITVVTVPAAAALQTNPILIAEGLSSGTAILGVTITTSAAIAGTTKFKLALHNTDDKRSTDTQVLANLASADITAPTVAVPAVAALGTNLALPIGTIVDKSVTPGGFRLFLFGDAALTNQVNLVVRVDYVSSAAMRFSGEKGNVDVNETVTAAT